MNPHLAILILFVIFMLGDVVSAYTRGYLSMILVSAIILMVGFWVVLPNTFLVDTGLLGLQGVLGIFLVHLGSTINIKAVLSDWKIVLIAVVGTLSVAAACFLGGSLVIDRQSALAAAPIAAGGNVAYLIMKDAYAALNRPEVDTFVVLVLVLQLLPGLLVAGILAKKIGAGLHEQYLAGTLVSDKAKAKAEGKVEKKLLPSLPKEWKGPNMIYAKLALLAYCGFMLSQATGINMLLFNLILGVIAVNIGFLEEAALVKSGGITFFIAVAIVAIYAGLARSTFDMVISLVVPLILYLVIGVVAMFVSGIVMGKILGVEWKTAVLVVSTAYYGLINGYIIAEEISTAISESEEEKQVMLDYFFPKILVGGIFSVFFVSAFAASIMSAWL